MKKTTITLIALTLTLGLATTSWPISFGDILKEVEKPRTAPEAPKAPPAPATPSAPAQPQGGGGLLGILEGTGVVKGNTAKTLRGVGQAIQSLQPIGYEEERAIGGSIALEVFNRFGGPYHNEKLQTYISLVGQSVVDVSDRADIPYHFAIVNSDQPNAFAAPGGYIFVSAGLLRLVKSEAELAGILGHEVAHVAKRHALQTIERSKSLQGISQLTTTIMDKDPGMFNKLISEMSETLFTKGLDKGMEFEADKYGTEYAYRVGYYPGGLKDFMKVLAKHQRSSSVFFSTHPSPRERYGRMNSQTRRYASAATAPALSNRYQANTEGQL